MSVPTVWPAPSTRHFSERQREIVTTLEQLFRQRSVRSLTLTDLTTAAHCSRSTLYEIAPGKEQLLMVVVDRIMRRVAARGRDAIAATDDPIEQIAAVATEAARGLGELSSTLVDSIADHPAATLLYERHVSEGRDVLERLVQDAIDQGRCRDVHPRVIAETLSAVILHFAGPGSRRVLGVPPSDAITEALGTVIAGLRASG